MLRSIERFVVPCDYGSRAIVYLPPMNISVLRLRQKKIVTLKGKVCDFYRKTR